MKFHGKLWINISCFQETKWISTKKSVVGGYKLWYSGSIRNKNGIGILIDDELGEQVVEVKMVNDRMRLIKLVIEGSC